MKQIVQIVTEKSERKAVARFEDASRID